MSSKIKLARTLPIISSAKISTLDTRTLEQGVELSIAWKLRSTTLQLNQVHASTIAETAFSFREEAIDSVVHVKASTKVEVTHFFAVGKFGLVAILAFLAVFDPKLSICSGAHLTFKFETSPSAGNESRGLR